MKLERRTKRVSAKGRDKVRLDDEKGKKGGTRRPSTLGTFKKAGERTDEQDEYDTFFRLADEKSWVEEVLPDGAEVLDIAQFFIPCGGNEPISKFLNVWENP